MNEKKLTALISVLAFGLAGMALVPVGMDASAEHAPLAQANEGTDHCIETESISNFMKKMLMSKVFLCYHFYRNVLFLRKNVSPVSCEF